MMVAVVELPDAAPTTNGAMPFPDKATDCGVSAALSATVTVPMRVPIAVGVKVTEI